MQIDILQQHILEFLPCRSSIVFHRIKAEFVEMYIFKNYIILFKSKQLLDFLFSGQLHLSSTLQISISMLFILYDIENICILLSLPFHTKPPHKGLLNFGIQINILVHVYPCKCIIFLSNFKEDNLHRSKEIF